MQANYRMFPQATVGRATPALLVVGLTVAITAACGKDKPAADKQPAAAAAGEPAPAAEAPAGPAEKASAASPARDRLAKAYPVLRCALVAGGGADDGLWKQHGFEGPAAFATAWQEAATADPGWARNVVSASLRTPCAAPAQAPPAVPTPTAAPAAGAADAPTP